VPRVSVVVPIYNVEHYVGACLESVAAQTLGDLEVVMVDDGSTDGSAAIAQGFAARDPRFRLLRQPNGGLSRARNSGIDAATGEFLAFLDSDDLLPANAYELLLGALDRSGSDFASGNVQRLDDGVATQAQFLARTFAQTRLRTHVTRQRSLLADRTAWNKLWRRSFWDAHELRFPDGVVHEDIPVTVPAHFHARSVDVIADPVYLWRTREGSITKRRVERRVLLDRLAAIDHVRGFLAAHGPRKAARWYDESVLADDLRLYLNELDEADDGYRELFLDRANGFLDASGVDVDRLPLAIDRLKWHLVRRRLLPELLEVLRFQRHEQARTQPVRVRGRWYGDYPFRGDRRLGVPRSAYRLGRNDRELAITAELDDLRRDGDRLRLRGRACIAGLGAPDPGSQRVELTALRRSGRWRRLRLRTAAIRLPTFPSRRDGSWSGFEAALELGDLRRSGRWVAGTWDLYTYVRAGSLRRRWSRFAVDGPQALDLPVDGDVSVRALATAAGKVTVQVREHWVTVRDLRRAGDAIELAGTLRLPAGQPPRLELVRSGDTVECAVAAEADAFRALVPAADGSWELWARAGSRRLRVALPAELDGALVRAGGRELTLVRTPLGDADLRAQAATAIGAAVESPAALAGSQAERT
jgi:CDP-glycerol glycerophosphotransferase